MYDEDFKVGRRFVNTHSGSQWVIYEVDLGNRTFKATNSKLLDGNFSMDTFDTYYQFSPDLPVGAQDFLRPTSKCECGSDALAWMSGHHDTRCPKFRETA